jgi:eukaryotic-like serine/threonine-protein kinase
MLSSAQETCVVDGRYRLLKRVGAGGAASVYRAEDLLLERDVAIKVLHPQLAGDQELVKRFRREAESAGRLTHRHVVAIYDRGEWDGTHYIAMEYVAGRSLKSIIREEAPLEPARAIDLSVQILRAAGAIHSHGIIHRDLKPDNAIVDGVGRLKVIDFGIAWAGASDITENGSILGSAHYLSPEQAEGAQLSGASDLYSVGVILYETLTARPPFLGETAVGVALKHLKERPTPPTALNTAVTPALESTVMRALEKDPARRFAEADAFIEALTEAKPAPAREETRHEHRLGGRDHHARGDRSRGVPHRLRHSAASR